MKENLTEEQQHQRMIDAIVGVIGPFPKYTVKERIEILVDLAVGWLIENPTVKLDDKIWLKLQNYSQGHLDTDLSNTLHQLRSHPDYFYILNQFSRTQTDRFTPVGNGWIINTYLDGQGRLCKDTEKNEYNEYQWFRRLKTDALRDTVDPFDHQRKASVDKVNLLAVLRIVISNVNELYFPMPSLPSEGEISFGFDLIKNFLLEIKDIKRPKYNVKPNYIEKGSFIEKLQPSTNVYESYEWLKKDNDVICFLSNKQAIRADPKAKYYYIHTKDVDILINMNKPFSQSFVRIDYKGVKERAPFVQWTHFSLLSINLFEIEKIVNSVR